MKRQRIFRFFVALSFLLTCFLSVQAKDQEADFRRRANQFQKKYDATDIEAEIVFGREVAAKILGRHPLVENEELQRYVSLLGTGLALQIGRTELKYYFSVIDLEDVNAYACPGGYIFITKGAMQVMTNEAQLVGVLAHEIAHVDRRHIVKQLNIKGKDESMTSGLAGVFGGSTGSVRVAMNMLVDKAYSMLFEEGISKEGELEADSDAVVSLISVGYDWESYKNFVASLNKVIYSGHGKVLSKTHPSTEARLNEIETIARQGGSPDYEGKVNAERFAKFVRFEEPSVAEDFSDLTVKTEISWGRELAARYLGKYKVYPDDELQKYVNLVGRGLSEQVGRSELSYFFAVLDSDEVRSLAFPGGYVFISRGALQSMENEAQLVGLLARELAEIEYRHLVRKIKASKSQGGEGSVVRLPINILADHSYAILEEEGLDATYQLEADSRGVELMTAVGFDWKAYRDYVAGLEKNDYYPASSRRLEAIDQTVNQKGLNDYEGKTNRDRFKKYVRF